MTPDLRERTTNAIVDGKPIYYCRPFAHGDRLIHLWSHFFVIKRLIEERQLDGLNPRLRSYPRGLSVPRGSVDLGDYMDLDSSVTDLHLSGVLRCRLGSVAKLLGVNLKDQDFKLVPQPVSADFYPWVDFNRDRIVQEGEPLRDQILKDHSKVIIIAQFGSQAEKRFSDNQVIELSEDVRKKDPRAYIAVLSDKDHLKAGFPKPWHRFTNKANFYAFPYKSEHFKTEVDNREFGSAPNEKVFGTDIYQFCKWLYASDLLVTTDSFASWLGSAMRSLRQDRLGIIKPCDVAVLHTIANPDIWGVPGATIVASNSVYIKQTITGSNFDFLNWGEYYAFTKGESIHWNDNKRGILARDVTSLKLALNPLLNA